MPFSAWLDTLPKTEDLEFVSTSFGLFRIALARPPFAAASVTETRILAGAVARIACAQLAAGLALDPAAIDANYVRRSDPELFWTEA